MAFKLLTNPFQSYLSSSSSQSQFTTLLSTSKCFHNPTILLQSQSKVTVLSRSGMIGTRLMARASVKEDVNVEEKEKESADWGKVSAVLFDMDGVLCNSEESSRLAAVDVFAEMGVPVTVEDFVPFMGTGKGSDVSNDWKL